MGQLYYTRSGEIRKGRSKFRQGFLVAFFLIIGGILSYTWMISASVSHFYPTSCLGEWEHPSNAQGKPELHDDAAPNEFNETNSALLRNTHSQLFCGSFEGEIPNDATLQDVVLKFSWTTKEKDESDDTNGTLLLSPLFLNEVSYGVLTQGLPYASSTPSGDNDDNVNDNTGDKDHYLEIRYTLEGSEWNMLGTVAYTMLEGTMFSLPLTHWDDLSRVQVSIQATGNNADQSTIYLDGMWLEALYEEIPRSGIFNANNLENLPRVAIASEDIFLPSKTTFRANEEVSFQLNLQEFLNINVQKRGEERLPLPDNRALEQEVSLEEEDEEFSEVELPKVEELSPATSTPPTISPTLPPTQPNESASSTPSLLSKIFSFPFNLFSSLFHTVFAKTPPPQGMLSATIIDPQGRDNTLHPIIEETEGRATIRIPQPGRSFKPGKYQVKVELLNEKEDNVLVATKDFTWGVLAINTNKSIYSSSEALAKEGLPSETAYLQMAVLTDTGNTVCDANLRLTIRQTTNDKRLTTFSTQEGTIQYSGECARNNVTSVPDYFAYYEVEKPGTYEMILTNLDNGYEITDSFEVKESVPFDIERIGPTRIYPPATYEMKLIIKANEDFRGEVIERVPDTFEIKNQNSKIISWEVDWNEGEMYELSYTFDAPDISPEFYLLGPLALQVSRLRLRGTHPAGESTFQESRSWQIAADGTVTWDGEGSTSSWSEAANWSGNAVPGAGDAVVFNGTNTENATVDASFAGAIAALSINSGYTGTITLARSLTMTGSYSQSDGTFDQAAQTLTVGGNFTLANGTTFTKASGGQALTFNGIGTITDNNTTKQDLGAVVIGGTNATYTLATAIKMTSLTINSGNTFILNGNNFEFSTSAAVSNSGTFQLYGTETLTNVTNLDIDSGTVQYVGRNVSETITIKEFGTTDYNALTINDNNANKANFTASTALTTAGAFNVVSAHTLTFDAAVSALSANVTANNTLTINSTFATTNGALSLKSSSSTVAINGAITGRNSTLTINASSTITIAAAVSTTNNDVNFGGAMTITSTGGAFTVTSAGSISANNGTLTISAGDGITIDGTVSTTNNNVNFGGAVSITTTSGNVTATAGVTANNGTLKIAAPGTMSVTTLTTTNNNANFGGALSLCADSDCTTNTTSVTASGEVKATNGTVTIKANNALSLATVTATNNNANFAAGVDLTSANSTITASGTVSSLNGNITLEGNSLSLAAVTGTRNNINFTTPISLTANSGSITTTGNLTTTVGTITMSATGGNITAPTLSAGGGSAVSVTTVTSGNVNVDTITTTGNFTITSAGTMSFDQGFTLNSGTFSQGSSPLTITGDFTLASGTTFTKATGGQALTFDATGNITDNNATKQDLGAIVIGGTSVTRTLTTAIKMTSLTINSGNVFSLNGKNFEFSTLTAVVNNGTFRFQGIETLTNVSNLDTDSGTVEYVGRNVAETLTLKDFGSTDYYNLTINDTNTNKATFSSGVAKVIAGTFTISSGTYTANANTTTVTGLVTVSGGTYQASTATQTFNGGVTISSGTFTGSSGDVDVNGNLTLGGGTLTAPSGSFTVSGDWARNGGTFTPGTNTVTFDAASGTQNIHGGGASFYALTHSGAGTLQAATSTLAITNNFTNSAGTFSLNGQNWTMTGATFSNTATIRLQGGETITGLTQDTDSGTWEYVGDGDSAADTFTFQDFGATDYFNVTISTTDSTDIIQSAASKVIAGTFTISGGTFNANGNTTNVTGLTTLISATYQASSGKQTFAGGFTISGSGFEGGSGDVDIEGDFAQTAGTYTATSGTMTVSGDFLRSGGTFVHNSGTVTLDGANQTITGSTTFNNFTKTVTTARTLTFPAGQTQTMVGTLTLQGASGALLSLRSSTADTQWSIDPQGTRSLSYLDVKDSNNTNSTPLECLTGCTNSGNNTNWVFVLTITQSAYRFFNNDNSTDVGLALANQDTSATAPSQGTPLRLRMLIHTTAQLAKDSQTFKLQVAERSGSCDTSFTGESYADVAANAGAIRFYNNTSPADATALTANANDPVHGADTIVNQTYEESNNVTNSQAAIPAGQDGKWDFALVDNSSQASTTYCFRMVKSDGNTLDTYSVIPEITTAQPTVQFTSTSSSGSEATTPANLKVSVSPASSQNVTVSYSATGGSATGSGTDYTLVNGTATITAGNTTTNISVTIVNDTLDEDNETIIVTISSPSNATLGSNTSHTYTITDAPTVSFDSASSSGSEATTSVNLAVSLSASYGKTITVDYSATGGTATGSGTDYTLADGTLTFNAGDTTKQISLTVVDDNRDESDDETIVITLSNPSNAALGTNTTHTYTITDDDVSGGGLLAGSSAKPVEPFSILINNGNPITNSRLVTLTLSAGTNVTRIALSNLPDFQNAILESFVTSKTWTLSPGEGTKTVYVKFYTKFGQASKVYSDSILYQVLPLPKPEGEEEKISPVIEVPSQLAKPFIPQEIEKPFIEEVGEFIEPLIPQFLKPQPLPPPPPLHLPPIEEVVREEAPLVFRGRWQLFPQEPIREFVFAPLPKSVGALVQQFPQVEQAFEELGITRMTDVPRLRGAKFALPRFQEVDVLPPEVVFVKAGGGKLDIPTTVTFARERITQQEFDITAGEAVTLIVKPNTQAAAVKGFVVFKKGPARRTSSITVPLETLLGSFLFASPSLAAIHDAQDVQTELVLLEFDYTDVDGDGVYTADIHVPGVQGEYEIITVIEYEDSDLSTRAIRLTTVIDPEGYVYEQFGTKEVRVPDAMVSLFWLNPETNEYELWSANEFRQRNPQRTDVTGQYSFLVPEGTYKLEVEAPEYLPYGGAAFSVEEGRGVHFNVELQPRSWWRRIDDWKTIALIILAIGFVVVALLLFYNFYRDRMRENRLKRN